MSFNFLLNYKKIIYLVDDIQLFNYISINIEFKLIMYTFVSFSY